jgi:hypothetical protein
MKNGVWFLQEPHGVTTQKTPFFTQVISLSYDSFVITRIVVVSTLGQMLISAHNIEFNKSD